MAGQIVYRWVPNGGYQAIARGGPGADASWDEFLASKTTISPELRSPTQASSAVSYYPRPDGTAVLIVNHFDPTAELIPGGNPAGGRNSLMSHVLVGTAAELTPGFAADVCRDPSVLSGREGLLGKAVADVRPGEPLPDIGADDLARAAARLPPPAPLSHTGAETVVSVVSTVLGSPDTPVAVVTDSFGTTPATGPQAEVVASTIKTLAAVNPPGWRASFTTDVGSGGSDAPRLAFKTPTSTRARSSFATTSVDVPYGAPNTGASPWDASARTLVDAHVTLPADEFERRASHAAGLTRDPRALHAHLTGGGTSTTPVAASADVLGAAAAATATAGVAAGVAAAANASAGVGPAPGQPDGPDAYTSRHRSRGRGVRVSRGQALTVVVAATAATGLYVGWRAHRKRKRAQEQATRAATPTASAQRTRAGRRR